ncbi:MAG: carboxypeptidase regulatory-like domain-containing protein [Candidatus Acidiferrales bacterium]
MIRAIPVRWTPPSLAVAAFAVGALLLSTPRPVAAQSDYTVINVEDGGTISGVVKWSGPVPKIPELPITKDPKICDPESRKTRDLERLEINSDNEVANTVVFLRGITRGKAMDLPDARQHLNQDTCRYVPHVMIVPQGGNLQIKSSDPVLHTVQMFGAATNNIPFPFQNQYIPVALHQNGVVELKCNAGHVWMNAVLLVVKHPYYSVTDEHGEFKLTNVPPGEYEIVAWHEGWQILSEAKVLDVGAQVEVKRPMYSSPESWTKKVTVKPGEPSTVDFTLSEKHE